MGPYVRGHTLVQGLINLYVYIIIYNLIKRFYIESVSQCYLESVVTGQALQGWLAGLIPSYHSGIIVRSDLVN